MTETTGPEIEAQFNSAWDALERGDALYAQRIAFMSIQGGNLHPEAYNILYATTEDVVMRLQYAEIAVKLGEREPAVADVVGETETRMACWGNLRFRTYLRAKLNLATALWESGQREEAIAHAEDLMRLNAPDNQGVRYLLAGWYLQVDEPSRTLALVKDQSTRTDTERDCDVLPHLPADGRLQIPATLAMYQILGDTREAAEVFTDLLSQRRYRGAAVHVAKNTDLSELDPYWVTSTLKSAVELYGDLPTHIPGCRDWLLELVEDNEPDPETRKVPKQFRTLAGRLEYARKRAGVDVEDVAESEGVHKNTVRAWELDRYSPPRERWPRLAELYAVTEEWLASGTHVPPELDHE